MPNPLSFTDLFGVAHTEPSVTGLIELQTVEVVRPAPVNDLILLSPFRSGKPGVLKRFRQMSSLAAYHDPYNAGDQGVALARTTRAPFGDDGVFGSADILTLRTDLTAKPSTRDVKNGSDVLFRIQTADFGFQTTRSFGTVFTNDDDTKKLVLHDDFRTFKSPALGKLFTVQYVGVAGSATLTILLDSVKFVYTGQVTDGDTVTVNGVEFEFDDNSALNGSGVAVVIAGSATASFDNLVTAINENAPGVHARNDTDIQTVFLSAPEVGLTVTEASTAINTPETYGKAARLFTVVNSVVDVNLSLATGGYKTIDAVLVKFNGLGTYNARLYQNANRSAVVNKFLPSNEIDVQTNIDILTTSQPITGYVASMIDWINHRTKGAYLVDLGDNDGTYKDGVGAVYGLPPDEDSDLVHGVQFAGGLSPAVTIQNIDDALTIVASGVERGGILLVDSDDPVVFSLVVEFISEQRSLGKWFRAFFGSQPGLTPEQYIALAGSIDNSRCRLYCQRPGIFVDSETTLKFLDPIFLAAAMAGGAAGNLPWKNPLTNKRVRFAAIHEDDNFDVVTREALLEGGVTVLKKEFENIVVSLAVTTSRDPTRRMPRIMSEVDTVDSVDADMRQAFLPFRGKWANLNLAAYVFTVGNAVLNFFSDPKQGALTPGEDQSGNPVPPWSWQNPAFTIFAGVLTLDYLINIAGELDHVSEHGRAEYVRIVGQVAGGATQLQTTVPA